MEYHITPEGIAALPYMWFGISIFIFIYFLFWLKSKKLRRLTWQIIN